MKKSLLAAAITLAAAPAFAEIDPIVIEYNSSRLGLTDQTSGRSVTVITQKELQNNGYTSVVDALSNVPGLSFAYGPTPTQNGHIRIRAADQKSILVVIDGVPSTDGTNGSFDLSLISAASVSRIEVIRGNSVAEYGEKAAGGVVFIETKPATAGGSFVSASVGRFGTTSVAAGTSTSTNAGILSAQISKARATGFDTTSPTNSYPNLDKDGYEDEAMQLAYEGSSVAADFRVSLSKEMGQTDYDQGTKEYSNLRYGAQISTSTPFGSLEIGASVGRFESGFDGDKNYINKIKNLELSHSLALLDQSLIGISHSTTNNEGSSYAAIDSAHKDSIFFEGAHRIGAYNSFLAVRAVDSDELNDVSWSVSLIKAEGNIRPFVSLSDSIVSPTPFDLAGYDKDGDGDLTDTGDIAAAPNLKPEQVKELEFGLSTSSKIIEGRLSLFGAQINDRIQRAYGSWKSPAENKPVNVDQSDRYGYEASIKATYPGFTHNLSVTRSISEDETGAKELEYPEYRAGYQVSKVTAYGKFGAGLDFESDREVSAKTSDERLLTNISWSKQLTKELQVNAKIDNVFDKTWESSPGYAGQPRFWSVTGIYRF